MSLEESLRLIVREELQAALAALAGLGKPKGVATHVSSAELMTSLSISRGTLRKMMTEGCPYTQPGKCPRFNVAEVEAWLKGRHGGR